MKITRKTDRRDPQWLWTCGLLFGLGVGAASERLHPEDSAWPVIVVMIVCGAIFTIVEQPCLSGCHPKRDLDP